MNWNNKITVKKGNIGEQIIRNFFEKKGWIIYKPITNKAHWIDFIAIKDKKEMYGIEVKTKPRLNKWAAQGFNIKQYKEYKRFEKLYNIKLFIFFVDEKEGTIHCANFSKLSKGFHPNDKIIAWHLDEMEFVANLDINTMKKIDNLNTRNYIYNPSN
jgi:Holliday junction resolvase-like predicted endonuclease